MFGSLLYNLPHSSGATGVTSGEVRRSAESAVMPIEHRLDYLELACAGLWNLLKAKHGYTDEELVASIQEVDARDGNVDGKIGRASRDCPHCHRKLLTRDSPKCAWCGGALSGKIM
jgi:hypothetical protein